MRIKIHFLNSHIDYFPKHLGPVGKSKGKISSRFERNRTKVSGKVKYRDVGGLLLVEANNPNNNFKGIKASKKNRYF